MTVKKNPNADSPGDFAPMWRMGGGASSGKSILTGKKKSSVSKKTKDKLKGEKEKIKKQNKKDKAYKKNEIKKHDKEMKEYYKTMDKEKHDLLKSYNE
jgi:hypothetical protein|tara:strand:+ start:14990 stop:15283 length:294 start_codon:yes stop_codon:yes gene_type:complete